MYTCHEKHEDVESAGNEFEQSAFFGVYLIGHKLEEKVWHSTL